ncbi:MAG: DUF3846 domain-containing protein [Oscillospiraceae bacterium]|nr:DUF3846 domain-containing protein [Oscillospiraceae bacterium]
MKEFEVTITETLQKTVNIEAETKEEAAQLVKEMWNNGDIILDADNFADVEYAADNGKEIEKLNELEVLLVEPGQYARMTTIEAGLSSMQEIVGGYIQAVNYFDEPVTLVCNEEGKINGMELNRAIKDENGKMIDIVAGTFFICGVGEENFTSLPPEHRAKFEKMFKKPEAFLKMGKGVMAIPIEPKKDALNKAAGTKNHGQEL